MSALATLSDLKALIGTSESSEDTLLSQMLARATARAESPKGAGRPLLRQADITEYPTHTPRRTPRIRLRHFPLESITSIKQLYAPSLDADFESEASLVENEDWLVTGPGMGDAGNRGFVERIYMPWDARSRCLQVIYTGGFIDPATEAPPAGSIQPPADLQHGILLDALQLFQHRNTGGMTISMAGGERRDTGNDLALHPALVDACQALRIIL